jgi:hypothetical protein
LLLLLLPAAVAVTSSLLLLLLKCMALPLLLLHGMVVRLWRVRGADSKAPCTHCALCRTRHMWFMVVLCW